MKTFDKRRIKGIGANNYRHGGCINGRFTKLYRLWESIKKRCADKKNKTYGGKGVTICRKWANNFQEFKKWAENNGYSPSLQIDRKNNDGNYSPRNCRFVTQIVNCRNRPSFKTTEKIKARVRQLRSQKLRYAKIAKLCGISIAGVHRVLKGKI